MRTLEGPRRTIVPTYALHYYNVLCKRNGKMKPDRSTDEDDDADGILA